MKMMTTKRTYKPQYVRINEIVECIKQGYTDPEDFMSATGLKISGILKYALESGVELPFTRAECIRYQSCSTFPKRDNMIDLGFSEVEMARSEGITREGARVYIISTGQHEKWKILSSIRRGIMTEFDRNLETFIKEMQQPLVDCLAKIACSKADNAERFAFDKTMECVNQPDQLRSIERYFDFFLLYKRAADAGEHPFNAKLARQAHVSNVTIGSIMKKLCMEKFNEYKVHKQTPKWKMDAIKRVCSGSYSQTDVAYFLGLNSYIASQRSLGFRKEKGVQYDHKPRCLKSFGKNADRECLTLRYASQIYEAHDLGFNQAEISELTDNSLRVVQYAIENRESIAPKITELLRCLYQKDSDKPYLCDELRRS